MPSYVFQCEYDPDDECEPGAEKNLYGKSLSEVLKRSGPGCTSYRVWSKCWIILVNAMDDDDVDQRDSPRYCRFDDVHPGFVREETSGESRERATDACIQVDHTEHPPENSCMRKVMDETTYSEQDPHCLSSDMRVRRSHCSCLPWMLHAAVVDSRAMDRSLLAQNDPGRPTTYVRHKMNTARQDSSRLRVTITSQRRNT